MGAGYYDVCFMGGVVRNPKRNIPLSCVGTCCIVAVIYVLTYIAVLGHLDWRTFVEVYSDHYEGDMIPPGIISTFTESRVGKWLAYPISVVVAITIFASNFSVLCGQHYVPYAAAKDGVFFSVFAHESKRYPGVADLSLLVVIILSGVWCFFSLDLVIEAMVNLIVFVQFLAQSVGLMYYRYRVPKNQQIEGWRMPLFPLPCIVQAVLFFFIWITTDSVLLYGSEKPILELAVCFLIAGPAMFLVHARYNKEWPFKQLINEKGDVSPEVPSSSTDIPSSSPTLSSSSKSSPSLSASEHLASLNALSAPPS